MGDMMCTIFEKLIDDIKKGLINTADQVTEKLAEEIQRVINVPPGTPAMPANTFFVKVYAEVNEGPPNPLIDAKTILDFMKEKRFSIDQLHRLSKILLSKYKPIPQVKVEPSGGAVQEKEEALIDPNDKETLAVQETKRAMEKAVEELAMAKFHYEDCIRRANNAQRDQIHAHVALNEANGVFRNASDKHAEALKALSFTTLKRKRGDGGSA